MDKKREKVLIISPNWLGDAVMSMPAVKEFRRRNTDLHITMLAKPSVAELWRMHDSADKVVVLPPGNSGTFRTAAALRALKIPRAIILPNSFRSALIPFLAGIPERRGFSRHGRRLLLTDAVKPFSDKKVSFHQKFEYLKLLCDETGGELVETGFTPPASSISKDLEFGDDYFIIGLIPGAARGDSKRWPYFMETASLLLEMNDRLRFIVLGSKNERELCESVACGIGDRAVNLAGKTDLREFAAVLGHCHLVLCNDSGGMHLASAAGVPVVAVYGITDPSKTGPIGRGAAVVRAESVHVSRDISRSSRKAAAALKSVSPEKVAETVMKKILDREDNA
ncbi:MAG: lipopolysaccharide heptosyltransferase II [Lentisphaerae bacterium]|jgi:heptosyltransferase-2|nr:lipopolysaccharide heptosyltransferase II [Lentisphaerota bacterium]